MKFLDDWWLETVGHANSYEVSDKTAPSRHARGLFVLGTDTDVGKTYVSELMIRHLVARGVIVGAYKPVASGADDFQQSDAGRLQRATGRAWPIERVCPQMFVAPLAPPIAAARQNRTVDDQLLRAGTCWWQNQCEALIVEGAGGTMSPLSPCSTVLDLAVDLGYPVVLVAAHRLGMMSHILLTLEALRHRNLHVLALVVNQVQPAPGSPVLIDESLACLLPFCGKIDCYRLDCDGSTLSPVAQSARITD